MNPWVVAISKGRERVAAENLSAQGFLTYFPKYLEKIALKGRIQKIIRPLFGRYFFVGHFGSPEKIINTRGVSSVVGEIRQIDVDGIRKREINGFVQIDRESEFRIGQRVRICGGIFDDMVGVYEGMSTTSREYALLSMMGRKIRVEVDAEDLVAA